MLTAIRSRAGARRGQLGMSLVELLVGVAVGLFVVAAASMLAATQLSDNRRVLVETQLQQDLRSAADIVTRELRRAGYWAQPELGVWSPTAAAVPNSYAALTTLGTTEVGFKYRRGPGQEGPYGFKLDTVSGALRTQLAASGWQDLTDPKVMRITSLTITPVNEPDIILPCPKLCPDGTTDCWPRLVVREFNIDITGQAASDSAVQRSLRTSVRLRNDMVRFNDPLNPTQICPP